MHGRFGLYFVYIHVVMDNIHVVMDKTMCEPDTYNLRPISGCGLRPQTFWPLL